MMRLMAISIGAVGQGSNRRMIALQSIGDWVVIDW